MSPKPPTQDSESSDEEVNFEKLKQDNVGAKKYNTFETNQGSSNEFRENVSSNVPSPGENNPHPPVEKRQSIKKKLSVQLSNSISAVRTQLQVTMPVPYDELDEKIIEKEKKTFFKKYRGFFYTLMSSFVFSVSALLVKTLHGYNPMTIALWRFQGALLPSVPLVVMHYQKKHQERYLKELVKKEKKHGRWTKIRTYLLLLVRSILTCNALLLHYYSLKYLPIGDALVINSCTPVFAYLFAFFFLGEPIGIMPILTSMVTLIGVVFIIKPPFLSGGAEFDMETLIGTGLALGSTILATCSYVMLRYIRRVHYSVTTLAYGVWGTIETLIATLALGYFSLPKSSNDWIMAAVLAGFTFIGQMAIILALKVEKAGPVTLIRTCDVIFGFIWQIFFWKLVPDSLSILGALIVISGVVVIAFRKWLESLNESHWLRTKLWFLLK